MVLKMKRGEFSRLCYAEWFHQSEWLRQSDWFRQFDFARFRDRHDKRFPLRISPSGSKVAGFGVSAAFSWGIAKINGFPFEFPQTVLESPVLAQFSVDSEKG